MKILLVDDDEILRSTMKMFMEQLLPSSVKIYQASDGLSAIDAYQNNYFDLIISDVDMPKMNGFEFYEKIKDKKNHNFFYFLTGFLANKDKFQEVKKYYKPIDVMEFVEDIKRDLCITSD